MTRALLAKGRFGKKACRAHIGAIALRICSAVTEEMARVDEPFCETTLSGSYDFHIRLFIAKRFIDEPEIEPVLQERVENVATIQFLYWRSGPENLTPLQVRTATPAQSRIRRAFEALENAGILCRVDRGWKLSKAVVAACDVNAIRTAEDLLEQSFDDVPSVIAI